MSEHADLIRRLREIVAYAGLSAINDSTLLQAAAALESTTGPDEDARATLDFAIGLMHRIERMEIGALPALAARVEVLENQVALLGQPAPSHEATYWSAGVNPMDCGTGAVGLTVGAHEPAPGDPRPAEQSTGDPQPAERVAEPPLDGLDRGNLRWFLDELEAGGATEVYLYARGAEAGGKLRLSFGALRELLDAHEPEAGREATRYLVECRDASGGWYYACTFPAWDRPESGAPEGYWLPCRVTPLGPVGPTTVYEPEEGP